MKPVEKSKILCKNTVTLHISEKQLSFYTKEYVLFCACFMEHVSWTPLLPLVIFKCFAVNISVLSFSDKRPLLFALFLKTANGIPLETSSKKIKKAEIFLVQRISAFLFL